MSDEDDGVIVLKDRRKQSFLAAHVTLDPADVPIPPKGPFVVTITGPDGKMFEVEFPDAGGSLPEAAPVLMTVGCSGVAVNLLAGALKVFAGAFL